MGKFITFEGGEGAGKSTQVRLLETRLRVDRGLDVVVTREPGGSVLAEEIRKLILANHPQDSSSEFLLFAAARAEHIAATIGPALKNGQWVICDRYLDSSRVYQGVLGGVPSEFIKAVEHHTVGRYVPDLTIILDVPAQLSMKRARERGELSRYDAAAEEQHQVLRDGFLEIAALEPDRCVVVDGARDVDEIAAEIYHTVSSRLLAGK